MFFSFCIQKLGIVKFIPKKYLNKHISHTQNTHMYVCVYSSVVLCTRKTALTPYLFIYLYEQLYEQ